MWLLLWGCAHVEPAIAQHYSGTYTYAWSNGEEPGYGSGSLSIQTDGRWESTYHVGGICRGWGLFSSFYRLLYPDPPAFQQGRWRMKEDWLVLRRRGRVVAELQLVNYDGKSWMVNSYQLAEICSGPQRVDWTRIYQSGSPRTNLPPVDEVCGGRPKP